MDTGLELRHTVRTIIIIILYYNVASCDCEHLLCGCTALQ